MSTQRKTETGNSLIPLQRCGREAVGSRRGAFVSFFKSLVGSPCDKTIGSWVKRDLTYRLEGVPSTLSGQVDAMVQGAFNAWIMRSKLTTLGFKLNKKVSGEVNIVIKWVKTNSTLSSYGGWADGPGEGERQVLFAREAGWTEDGRDGTNNFRVFILHEMGHMLGLGACRSDVRFVMHEPPQTEDIQKEEATILSTLYVPGPITKLKNRLVQVARTLKQKFRGPKDGLVI